jgi:hypothetical protein
MAKALRVVPAFREFVLSLRREIIDMNGLPIDHSPPGYPVAIDEEAFLKPV